MICLTFIVGGTVLICICVQILEICQRIPVDKLEKKLMMFGDSEVNIVGFSSSAETKRTVSDGSSQTTAIQTSNKHTQSSEVNSQQSQANPVEAIKGLTEPQPYDSDRLLTFLNRIMPQLEEELRSFSESSDSMKLVEKSNEEFHPLDRLGQATETFESSSNQVLIHPDYCRDKIISSLSWNCTGKLLALSYCEKKHEGWCCHETSVGIYNTDKVQFEKHPPDHSLETSGCVRCVQFHPYTPLILAAGLHTGQVMVWDLSKDESFVNSRRDEGSHTDAVTSVTWRDDRNGLWLITTGRDGKIIFWKVAASSLTYEPQHKFLITKQQSGLMSDHHEVLHLSFCSHKESDFVVAAGENIFHCSLKRAKALTSSNYKDPVFMTYKPHNGIVTSLSCSPNSDLFASCGMDATIRVYKYESSSPLHVIHTDHALMGVIWVNADNCLVTWGSSPKAEFYKINVQEERHVSHVVCEVEDQISAIALNSVKSRYYKMAVGNTTGQVLQLTDVEFFKSQS